MIRRCLFLLATSVMFFVSAAFAQTPAPIELPAGLQGMTCQQCITQCQQRNSAMNNNPLKPVHTVQLARVVRNSVGSDLMQSNPADGNCSERCSRLRVNMCLRACHAPSRKLQYVCTQQCQAASGPERNFCMQTCLSSSTNTAQGYACSDKCQSSSCH